MNRLPIRPAPPTAHAARAAAVCARAAGHSICGHPDREYPTCGFCTMKTSCKEKSHV